MGASRLRTGNVHASSALASKPADHACDRREVFARHLAGRELRLGPERFPRCMLARNAGLADCSVLQAYPQGSATEWREAPPREGRPT